jgi:EAL domain-containing protein (putative c-di-GMP-specific phosphodiesterase class I)/GGDEF domain-containing protein
MTQDIVTHVLVAAGGNGATAHIIDQLQKEGMSVSAATADNTRELASLLKQPQWEAVICFEDCDLSASLILDLTTQNEPTLPVILVTSADKVLNLLPMLEQGIADVVPVEQAKRLFLSVQRETANFRLKRKMIWLENNQRRLEEHYCAVLSTSASPISYIHDGMHLYCNQSYATLFGFEHLQAALTTPFLDLIQERDHSLVTTLLSQSPQKEEALGTGVVLRDRNEGRMMLTFTPVEFRQKSCMKVTGYSLTNASPAKLLPAQKAANDLLGNLPNDSQFAAQLEAAIRTARQTEVCSSLLVIALNDRIRVHTDEGKTNLNLMLNDMTRFLTEYFQTPFSAARLDDQVLGLILADAEAETITAFIALIKRAANRYFSSANTATGEPNCTIGSALINGREQKNEYEFAQASRNLKPAQFDKIRQNMMQGKPAPISNTELLEHLMSALTQKRFKLLYQPVVHIKGSNHQGYEVLSRMLDENDKEILPETFLRVANQHGIGEELDKLIITLAMDALEQSPKTWPLIINITSDTLMSHTFLPWLEKQFENRKISADAFAIALAETDIHHNEKQAIEFCRSLALAGLKLVISRFGCTLDPYAILTGIKPDLIKLDSSLLKDIAKRPLQRTKVQTLINNLRNNLHNNLHNNGTLVVAPQVETLSALPVLWDIGLDYVQGYALAAPSHEMNYNFLVEEEITLSAGRIPGSL